MSDSTVRDVMDKNLVFIGADACLEEAAQKMKTGNCGILPVGTARKVEGVITDRDIVIRAMACGKSFLKNRVRDYMTLEIIACREDDSLSKAAEIMQDRMVNRLIVKNGENRVTGILSFGDVLRYNADATVRKPSEKYRAVGY